MSDASAEVIARHEGVAGFLSLNRPRAIHALTTDMVRLMTGALLDWRDDPAVAVVLSVILVVVVVVLAILASAVVVVVVLAFPFFYYS